MPEQGINQSINRRTCLHREQKGLIPFGVIQCFDHETEFGLVTLIESLVFFRALDAIQTRVHRFTQAPDSTGFSKRDTRGLTLFVAISIAVFQDDALYIAYILL